MIPMCLPNPSFAPPLLAVSSLLTREEGDRRAFVLLSALYFPLPPSTLTMPVPANAADIRYVPAVFHMLRTYLLPKWFETLFAVTQSGCLVSSDWYRRRPRLDVRAWPCWAPLLRQTRPCPNSRHKGITSLSLITRERAGGSRARRNAYRGLCFWNL
ncbi:hypothetical protein LZ30DRAFT_739661 [Colletotrichum cereale]|nr:hypothetical protein LZ30DRAFT_739661 [Colletotrichum cereale]